MKRTFTPPLVICVGRALGALLLAALVQTIAAAHGPGGGPDALKERFLSEAPGAWREYGHLAAQLQGRYGCRAEVKQTFHSIEHWSSEFKSNSQCKLIAVMSEKVADGEQQIPYHEVVYGVNPRYAFEVRRDAANAPWYLRNVIDLSTEEVPSLTVNRLQYNSHLLSHLSHVGSLPLAELVKIPEFRLVNIRTVRRDDEDLVEVTFESPQDTEAESTIQSGVLVLDPGRFWCLREYEVKEVTENMDVKVSFRVSEFAVPQGSVPVAKHIFVDHAGTVFEKPFTRTDRYEFNLAVPQSLPSNDEFTLSAFDLPEPFQVTARGTRWFLWAALLGIGCLILGGLLLRLRRRRDGHAAASP